MRVIEAGSPPASSPIPSRVAVYHPLTHREAQVYALLDQGLKDREIALQLQISVRTVEKHVENILRKLGVETRTAAAARAIFRMRRLPPSIGRGPGVYYTRCISAAEL